jgi:hypothetical protein
MRHWTTWRRAAQEGSVAEAAALETPPRWNEFS